MGEGIVLLGGRHASTRIVCHALRARWPRVVAIIEAPIPPTTLVRRRVAKLGLGVMAGQLAFRAAVAPALFVMPARRRRTSPGSTSSTTRSEWATSSRFRR